MIRKGTVEHRGVLIHYEMVPLPTSITKKRHTLFMSVPWKQGHLRMGVVRPPIAASTLKKYAGQYLKQAGINVLPKRG